MVQQALGGLRGVAVAGSAPSLHVLPQRIDQWQIVALFFGEQLHLAAAGALRAIPVARFAAVGDLLRQAS